MRTFCGAFITGPLHLRDLDRRFTGLNLFYHVSKIYHGESHLQRSWLEGRFKTLSLVNNLRFIIITIINSIVITTKVLEHL